MKPFCDQAKHVTYLNIHTITKLQIAGGDAIDIRIVVPRPSKYG